MKKILAVFISLIALIGCLSMTASAAQYGIELSIKTESEYEYDGETVRQVVVEVYIKNNPGLMGLTFEIEVPDAFNYDSASRSSCVLDADHVFDCTKSADFKVSGAVKTLAVGIMSAYEDAIVDDGLICTITFTVDPTLLNSKDDLKLKINPVYADITTDEEYTPESGEFTAPDPTIVVPLKEDGCTHPEEEREATGKIEATCQKPGNTGKVICKFCGETVTDGTEIPQLKHEADPDDDWQVDAAKGTHFKLCKYGCGTHVEEAAHVVGDNPEWKTDENNLHHYHVCTVCGGEVDYAEHDDADSDGTCDTCKTQLHEHEADTSKKLLYDDGGHYYPCKYEGCTHKCDYTKHTTEVETKPATCTEEGSETTYCTECDYKKTVTLEKVPHTYNTDPDEVKEATCEKDGLKTWTCTVCKKQTKTEVISATGHKNDGTWKSDGTNHWHVCLNKNCDYEDKIYDKAAHTPKADLEHDEDAHWTVCSVCGKEGEHEEHTEGEAYVDENGHGHLCADCPEKFDYEAHKLTKVEAVEATPGQNGHIAYWTCENALCANEYYFIDGDGDGEPDTMVTAKDFDKVIVTKYAVGCETLGHQFLCVPATDEYHLLICARQCGVAIPMPHNFTINGRCRDCGYVRPALTTGVVVTPVTSGDIYNEVLPYGVIGVYDVSATGLTGRVAVRVFAPNATVNSIVLVRSGWDVLTSANLTVDGSGYATFMVDAAVINQYRYFAIVSNFTADDEVEVHTPIEPGDQDSQEEVEEPGDDITVDDTDDVKEDENPKTGVALAVIPMIVAAACTVVSKKH